MIYIKKVDKNNVWDLLKLEVADEQKNFVATNTESIVEAYLTVDAGGVALPFGIYCGDTPVGFLMIGYDDLPGEKNPSVSKGNYCIWRFMIDKKHQGKGFGRQALSAALDHVRSFPCGKAEKCFLSYEPENTVAAKLYHSFGFVENGEYDDGEVIAVLTL